MNSRIASLFQTLDSVGRYRDAGDITRDLAPLEPLYLFCPDALRAQAGRFLRGFPGRVGYAIKANPETRVLETLSAAGIGDFDVASLAEVRLLAATCPGATLHFNNPVKAEEAVREAYLMHGVRSFTIDDWPELEKVHRASGGDTAVTFAVRFRLEHAGAAYDFGSKFGADETLAAALLRGVAERGARPALTFHPGSQCTQPEMYGRYLAAAARIARLAGVAPAFVNIGGGFPVDYRNAAAPPLESYFDAVRNAAGECFPAGMPLLCEPGRAMAAPCVSLLTRVIHVRDDGCTLFLNDGVYGGMQEQSLVDLELPVRAWREGEPLAAGETVGYRVFGPTCDPLDRLSRPLDLPRGVRPGDYLEFGLLGAYGSATATRFNGFGSTLYVEVQECASARAV